MVSGKTKIMLTCHPPKLFPTMLGVLEKLMLEGNQGFWGNNALGRRSYYILPGG